METIVNYNITIVILGLYLGLCRGYIGIMEYELETTVVHWVYRGYICRV